MVGLYSFDIPFTILYITATIFHIFRKTPEIYQQKRWLEAITVELVFFLEFTLINLIRIWRNYGTDICLPKGQYTGTE